MYDDPGTPVHDWFFSPGNKIHQLAFDDSTFTTGKYYLQLDCVTSACHLDTADEQDERNTIYELDLADKGILFVCLDHGQSVTQ